MAKSSLLMPLTAWYSQVQASHSVNAITILQTIGVSLLLFFISDPAFAAATDIHAVLKNLRNVIYPLTYLVLIISYIAGIIFIFKAITMMKKFGMMNTMQSQPGELGGPLVYLLVGAILLWLPSATDITMNSVFGEVQSIWNGGGVNYSELGTGSTILGYSNNASLEAQWADLANTLVIYIQFLGFLSFVKGWFLLAKAGQHNAQQGSLAKGFTHIIGGIGLINIVGFFKIIRNTVLGTG